jgi:hypothetical protein
MRTWRVLIRNQSVRAMWTFLVLYLWVCDTLLRLFRALMEDLWNINTLIVWVNTRWFVKEQKVRLHTKWAVQTCFIFSLVSLDANNRFFLVALASKSVLWFSLLVPVVYWWSNPKFFWLVFRDLPPRPVLAGFNRFEGRETHVQLPCWPTFFFYVVFRWRIGWAARFQAVRLSSGACHASDFGVWTPHLFWKSMSFRALKNPPIIDSGHGIDYGCADGRFLMSPCSMAVSNTKYFYNSETRVNAGIRGWKLPLSESIWCQESDSGICFANKLSADSLQSVKFSNTCWNALFANAFPGLKVGF